jgi:hypothetical protein
VQIVIDTNLVEDFNKTKDSMLIRSHLYFLKNKKGKYILFKNSLTGNKVGSEFTFEKMNTFIEKLTKNGDI